MYSFGEIKKTVAAFAGLATTALAYIAADETLSGVFPPQWIAAAGGLLTILGVFKVENDPTGSPDRAVTSLQDVRKELDKTVDKANKSLEDVVANVNRAQVQVGGSSGGLADRAIWINE